MVLEHSWCPLCGRQFLGMYPLEHSCVPRPCNKEAGAEQDSPPKEVQMELDLLSEGEK